MFDLRWVMRSYLRSIQHGNESRVIAHPYKSQKTGEALYLLGEVLFASELLTADAREYLIVGSRTVGEYIRIKYRKNSTSAEYMACWRSLKKAEVYFDEILECADPRLDEIVVELRFLLFSASRNGGTKPLHTVFLYPFDEIQASSTGVDETVYRKAVDKLSDIRFAVLQQRVKHIPLKAAEYFKYLYYAPTQSLTPEEVEKKREVMKLVEEVEYSPKK